MISDNLKCSHTILQNGRVAQVGFSPHFSLFCLVCSWCSLWIFLWMGTWLIDLYWRHYVSNGISNTARPDKELSILQVKLNELIAVTKNADNRLMNVEDLTKRKFHKFKKYIIKSGGRYLEKIFLSQGNSGGI